jgi:hypothetical protein
MYFAGVAILPRRQVVVLGRRKLRLWALISVVAYFYFNDYVIFAKILVKTLHLYVIQLRVSVLRCGTHTQPIGKPVKFLLIWLEVLTAVIVKMTVFWVVAPGRLAWVYRRFRGVYCMHHQVDESSAPTALQPRWKPSSHSPSRELETSLR